MNKNECIWHHALELAQAANFIAATCKKYPAETNYLLDNFKALTIHYEHLKKLF